MKTQRAAVWLGDSIVGLLTKTGGGARFEPAESWARQAAGLRPILGQQFEDDPFAAHKAGMMLPMWFEHLLPEMGGPLRSAVARSVNVEPHESFELIVALGRDLPGAVVVMPAQSTDEIATLVRREREAVAVEASSDPDDQPLRVSLAGLQFKLSARVDARGAVLPASGEEANWIVKFAGSDYKTLPRNEYLTMTWARASGIDVPAVELRPTSDVMNLERFVSAPTDEAFLIRRYDRTSSGRVHQEDFAQVRGLPPGERPKYNDINYDTIVRTVAALCPEDLEELIRRLVFMVVCGNDDAHAKNWSLWYPRPACPRLSPAYDLVFTLEYLPENDMALKLAKTRRFEEANRTRFRMLAARVNLDPSWVDDVVVTAVKDQVAAWHEISTLSEIYPAYKNGIERRLDQLSLVTNSLA